MWKGADAVFQHYKISDTENSIINFFFLIQYYYFRIPTSNLVWLVYNKSISTPVERLVLLILITVIGQLMRGVVSKCHGRRRRIGRFVCEIISVIIRRRRTGIRIVQILVYVRRSSFLVFVYVERFRRRSDRQVLMRRSMVVIAVTKTSVIMVEIRFA